MAARVLVCAGAAAAAAGASGAARGGRGARLRGWASIVWPWGWSVAAGGQEAFFGW